MAESKTEQINEQSRYLRGTIAETLRGDASDKTIQEYFQEYLKSVVIQKEDRHHIGSPREIPNGVEEANQPRTFISRGEREFVQPQQSMSCIGG